MLTKTQQLKQTAVGTINRYLFVHKCSFDELLEMVVFEFTQAYASTNILPTVGQLIRISYGTGTIINKFRQLTVKL